MSVFSFPNLWIPRPRRIITDGLEFLAHKKKSGTTGHMLKNANGHMVKGCAEPATECAICDPKALITRTVTLSIPTGCFSGSGPDTNPAPYNGTYDIVSNNDPDDEDNYTGPCAWKHFEVIAGNLLTIFLAIASDGMGGVHITEFFATLANTYFLFRSGADDIPIPIADCRTGATIANTITCPCSTGAFNAGCGGSATFT